MPREIVRTTVRTTVGAEQCSAPTVVRQNSGITWLGDIPEDWEVLALKHLVATKISDGPHETPEIIDNGIPFISAESIKNNKINFDLKRGYISEELHKLFCRKVKPKRNDIFIVKSGATTGRAAIVETDEEFSIWSPLAMVRPNPKKVDHRFLFQCILSELFQKQIQVSWSFGTQQNIGMGVIEKLPIPLPPLPEQKAIAAFLDRKTQLIDSLIAKKREMLDRLKEKRSALISHAVTRGIPGGAGRAMKKSGVTWLGDIPADWDVKKLAYLTKKIGSGKTPNGGADVYQSTGILFIRSQNVYDTGLYLDDVVYISEEIESGMTWSRVYSGDILLNITGASLGRTCLVPQGFPRANVNQHVCIIRIAKPEFEKFISIFLKSNFAKSFYDLSQNGSGREGLNFEQISKIPIPLPPLPEQKAIAEFLDIETGKIDKLADKIKEGMERLTEYRSALITAAVTGQIDLRGEAPENHKEVMA